jgi:hypothetical protein
MCYTDICLMGLRKCRQHGKYTEKNNIEVRSRNHCWRGVAIIIKYYNFVSLFLGARGWLRHCATNQKIAGSIPDDVTGIFHWHNHSGRTMALDSTQPLTEISTRNISWGVKAAGAWGWQYYHLHMPTVFVWDPQPPRTLRACPDLYRDCFNFICILALVFRYVNRIFLAQHCTGCFKKSFTTLKAYRNLYRGHTQRFKLSKCSKTHRVLPRIVIRNCFDRFFRFLLHGTSTVIVHRPGKRVLRYSRTSKVTYNFESVQRTYTTFWTVKM